MSKEPEVVARENLPHFTDSSLVLDATSIGLPALAPACGDRTNFRIGIVYAFLPVKIPFCLETHVSKKVSSAEVHHIKNCWVSIPKDEVKKQNRNGIKVEIRLQKGTDGGVYTT